MFNEFMKDGEQLWGVTFCNKVTDARCDNHYINVSGETVEEVISKLKVKYPGSKIITVSHKGRIDI
jgi:hypothetical protein